MIRILIADDHAIVRSGLRRIIATTSDMIVVDEAADSAEVLEKLHGCSVELLLLDMTITGGSCVELIRRVRVRHPSLPVLVLSVHDQAQAAARALRAGATGYLTKDSEIDTLLAAIRKVAGGGRFIDPKFVDAMVFGVPEELPPHEALSDREIQVLHMLAAGRRLNEIADACSLSAKTVSTHKMRLMQKLGLANNAQVVRYAIRHGLVGDI